MQWACARKTIDGQSNQVWKHPSPPTEIDGATWNSDPWAPSLEPLSLLKEVGNYYVLGHIQRVHLLVFNDSQSTETSVQLLRIHLEILHLHWSFTPLPTSDHSTGFQGPELSAHESNSSLPPAARLYTLGFGAPGERSCAVHGPWAGPWVSL